MKSEYIRQDELWSAMDTLPFEERFLMLVNAEQNRRDNHKLTKNLRDACLLDRSADLKNVIYLPARKLNQQFIARMSGCSFIKEGRDLLITGATGVGKTFITSAIGAAACSMGYSVRAFKMHRLLMDLNVRVNDGTYIKTLADLIKPDVLILDDFGMEHISPNFCRYFLEVIDERRYAGSKSLLITAQLPVSEWHGMMGDRTAADAVMDRLVNHDPYRLELQGPSMRKVMSAQKLDAPFE
jgi:DNA replication protein DnaC